MREILFKVIRFLFSFSIDSCCCHVDYLNYTDIKFKSKDRITEGDYFKVTELRQEKLRTYVKNCE